MIKGNIYERIILWKYLTMFYQRYIDYFLGQCHMTNLQTAISDLKFRAILHFRGEKMMCPSSGGDGYGMKYGVMKFALPIIRNYPKLRMNNTIYQNF